MTKLFDQFAPMAIALGAYGVAIACVLDGQPVPGGMIASLGAIMTWVGVKAIRDFR